MGSIGTNLTCITHFASLRNSILHDASHVGDRKVDVLLPEVLFDTAIIMVIHTLLSIVYTKQTHTESALSQNLKMVVVSCTSATHHLETGGRSDRMPCTLRWCPAGRRRWSSCLRPSAAQRQHFPWTSEATEIYLPLASLKKQKIFVNGHLYSPLQYLSHSHAGDREYIC